MQKRWWIPLMILACLLWAVSCAQKGAEEVMGIGVRPAASGTGELVVVEAPEPVAGEPEQDSGIQPAEGLRLHVAGEGKDLTECSRPPQLTVAGCANAIHPSCTWTADGATMIACGMAPLDMLDLLETVPFDTPDDPVPELLFEVEPDRISLRFALLEWDENGELLTDYDDFTELTPDGKTGDFTFPPADSVVEINAEWDERDGFGGHALYVFRAGGSAE